MRFIHESLHRIVRTILCDNLQLLFNVVISVNEPCKSIVTPIYLLYLFSILFSILFLLKIRLCTENNFSQLILQNYDFSYKHFHRYILIFKKLNVANI